MKNILLSILLPFGLLLFLSSCDPKSCSEYIIENELEQNVRVILYTDSEKEILNIDSKNRIQLSSSCVTGGKVELTLKDTDSIHILLENGAVLKYTNDYPTNTIYDTKNRDIWVEEYGKETKYKGGDYRFVYTIKESDIGG